MTDDWRELAEALALELLARLTDDDVDRYAEELCAQCARMTTEGPVP